MAFRLRRESSVKRLEAKLETLSRMPSEPALSSEFPTVVFFTKTWGSRPIDTPKMHYGYVASRVPNGGGWVLHGSRSAGHQSMTWGALLQFALRNEPEGWEPPIFGASRIERLTSEPI
jgi:hypothetical protein